MTNARKHKLLKHRSYLALKKAKEEGTEELSAASIVDAVLANGFRLQGVGINVSLKSAEASQVSVQMQRIQNKHLDVEQNVKLYGLVEGAIWHGGLHLRLGNWFCKHCSSDLCVCFLIHTTSSDPRTSRLSLTSLTDH